MPLFQLDIEKSYQGEFWTNRYILEATDVNATLGTANIIVDAEQDVHNNIINFTKYRVSDIVKGTDNYVIVPINSVGGRVSVGSILPLFNVARVDFGVGIGRPSRKYLRIGFTEADIDGSVIVPALVTALQNYGALLVSLAQFVDVDAQPITSSAVVGTLQMRQLRRGSRRRTQPVIQ